MREPFCGGTYEARGLFSLFMCYGSLAFSNSDLLDTVKVTKALLEKGYDVSTPVAVSTGKRWSSPPLRCVMIVTERKPNTECPGDVLTGENLDKGVVGCLSDTTNEVVQMGGFTSACPPPL